MAVEASSPRARRLGRIAFRCQPDQRLVALTREGSDAAFEEIVGRYRDRLVAYAARIAPAGRGEDVVQEALMRALSALRRSGDPIDLRPWLYRIVRNRALNDLRDQPTHEELSEEADGVPQPPEVAARRADLAAMLAELKSLPDAQRRALVQRELEGRSHEEIATALAVTPGAVRGLIFRARTALRDAVGAVIPLPVLRFLAESGGGGGGGATVAAASAGGAAAKLGVGLTVAVVAVGSGIALEVHRGHHSPAVAEAQASRDPAVAVGAGDAAAVAVAPGSGGARADDGGHRGGSGRGGPGPSGNRGPGPGSNSGPASGDGGSGASSGSGSGSGDQPAGSGEGGPGGSGPSLGSGSSGPGSGSPGSGSGDLTSGSSGPGSGSSDGGTSGPG